MKSLSGGKAFWLSFLLTAALLVPIILGFWLYGMYQKQKQTPVQAQQGGIPIQQPTQDQDYTLLVTVAAEQPAFVLIRLNPLEQQIKICAVPAQTQVTGPTGPLLLQDSYAAAGPGRAAELLGQTLNIQIDHYLAITTQSLEQVWQGMEPMRVNLTGLLEADEQEQLGLLGDPVLSLTPMQAHEVLEKLNLPPVRLARLRAAIWDAALRQQPQQMKVSLPQGLQGEMARLLTDLTVTDLYELQKILGWLGEGTTVDSQGLPGRYQQEEDRFVPTQETVTFARSWFKVQNQQEAEVQQDQQPETAQPEAAQSEAAQEPSQNQEQANQPAQQQEEQPTATPVPQIGPPAGALG